MGVCVERPLKIQCTRVLSVPQATAPRFVAALAEFPVGGSASVVPIDTS
jgi:hypothetical protein